MEVAQAAVPAPRARAWVAGPSVVSHLVIAALAVLLPLPILLLDGWNVSHDWVATFERIEGLRRAFVQGYWYPLWTPFCHYGFGSPFPLFYPRLYSSLAALLAQASGSVIWSVKAMTVVLLFTGGAGMWRLLRTTGSSDGLALTGAVLFMVAPYTLTDWFTRGSMAEFTAMMLLPLAYAEMFSFIRGERHWVRFAVVLTLLFHGHPMICYFFLLSALLFFVVSVAGPWRRIAWQGVTKDWPHVLAAFVILSVGVLAHVVVATPMLKYFNIEELRKSDWWVEHNYRPLRDYFVDTRPVEAIWHMVPSVEVNRYLLGALLILHLLPGAGPRWREVSRDPLYGYFAGWSAICFLLQIPFFAFVFHALPQGDLIDFPWRLVSFMTIGLIFLVIRVARPALETAGGVGRTRMIGLTVLGVATVASAAQFGSGPVIYANPIVADDINFRVHELDGPIQMGEFLLKGGGWPPERGPFVTPVGCSPRISITEPFQDGELRMTADSEVPCRVILRQYQTPLVAVTLENARLLSQSPAGEYSIELAPGHSSVRLRARHFWEVLVRNLTRANPDT